MIAANDSVVELETEKAVVELPCPHAGKVAKIHVAKGQTIKVGQPLLTIESEDAEPAPAEKPKAESGKRKAEAVAEPAHRPSPEAPSPTVSGPKSPLPAGPESRRLASWASTCHTFTAPANRGGLRRRTSAPWRRCGIAFRGRRPSLP